MEWNVFYHDFNKQKIVVFNIFEHWRFNDDVKKSLKKFDNKEEFAERLKRDLLYYFWSKCEYEIVITSWCGGRNTKDIKIDVYDQVMNNWDIFVDYVWSNKKQQRKKSQ